MGVLYSLFYLLGGVLMLLRRHRKTHEVKPVTKQEEPKKPVKKAVTKNAK